jgi:formamidopyrimidine-DNA glycosylase
MSLPFLFSNLHRDEVLFQARVHPEQYTNSLSDEQLKRLHQALLHVCSVAVETLADSEKYPENWLVKYRWGKGKGKKENQLPTGEKITFLTVGGRTSAVVPSVQKKTGPVAQDVEEPEDEAAADIKGDADNDGTEADDDKKKSEPKRKRRAPAQSKPNAKSGKAEEEMPASKKRKAIAKAPKAEASAEGRQTRRSARLSKYFEE